MEFNQGGLALQYVNPRFKVWAEVDMLTDEVLRVLEWKEKTFADVQVVIVSGRGVLRTALSKGVMFHLGETIPVAFRIDKGELRAF